MVLGLVHIVAPAAVDSGFGVFVGLADDLGGKAHDDGVRGDLHAFG